MHQKSLYVGHEAHTLKDVLLGATVEFNPPNCPNQCSRLENLFLIHTQFVTMCKVMLIYSL